MMRGGVVHPPMITSTQSRFTRAARSSLWLLLLLSLTPARVAADELKDARAALAAGKLEQAQQLFEKAASQGYAEGRAGVGLVFLRRRQLDQALEAFKTAQKMDGNLALAHWGEGEVYRRQDRCADAVPKFRRAVEIDRKFPEAQLALGDCLVRLKQHDEAVAALTTGLQWGPKQRPRFLVALGQAELARDSLRDAGIFFTTARQESPEDPAPRRALGDFYLKRGIPALAIPEYQAAVSLDSMDVELHHALGQALYYDRRYNDALDEYRWVTIRDPDYAPGQLALGNLYYLSGQADSKRYADALPYLERYTTMEPNDPKGWSLLGRNQYFLKMKDEAVANMLKAASLGETSKDLYTILGRAYADRREWQSALDAYAKGEPNTTDLLKMGQMYVFLGSVERADSVYRSMMERDSTSSDAKFALVELLKLRFRQKDYPGTIELAQRRIALDPNSDEAYYYMGLSYKEMKQIPESIGALRQAATLAPSKPERHFWLGLLLAQADSVAEARGAFLRTVELDSTSKNAAIAYQQLGYRALLDRSYVDAIHVLERSSQINDKDVQTWVWLGQAYQNSGNRAKALEAYNRALALNPAQPDALKGKKTLGA